MAEGIVHHLVSQEHRHGSGPDFFYLSLTAASNATKAHRDSVQCREAAFKAVFTCEEAPTHNIYIYNFYIHNINIYMYIYSCIYIYM